MSEKNNSFENRVVNILLELEIISTEQLELAKKSLTNSNHTILQELTNKKFLSRKILSDTINSKLGIPIIDLKPYFEKGVNIG